MSSAKAGDPREAASCGGVGHEGEQGRDRGGWVAVGRERKESREQRKRVERERAEARVFWKMVYGNFFRKPFSQIY